MDLLPYFSPKWDICNIVSEAQETAEEGEGPQDREESCKTLCPECDMAVVPTTPQQPCLLA